MIHFGTGGWRAIIADEFTKRNIQILARALSFKMKDEKVSPKIVIGYDRRFLSKETVHWLCEVFAAENIKVYFANRSVPTPTIMYYVMAHHLNYGLMVTASHNPAIYNGIKVFTYGGRDADEETTKDIERYVRYVEEQKNAYPIVEYDEAVRQGMVIEFNPLNEYLDAVIQKIDMVRIREAGLHVALDAMYGVSGDSLRTILFTARCDLNIINDQHDTLFGGKLPAPTNDTLHALQSYVIDHHCDIGLATDGDADRIGVIDDKGRYLTANEIVVLLYYYLVKYKGWKGAAVRNVATTHMLDRVAHSFGEECYEVPVGFKYISSKMMEVDALIGGESSGGLTVRGHTNGKDGVYAAALLTEMLAVTGMKISEIKDAIVQEYGSLYMEETSFRLSNEKKEEVRVRLLEQKQVPDFGKDIEKVYYLDGCKIVFADESWLIVRFSGTEPLLRVFCEAENADESRKIINRMKEFLGI